MRSSGYNRSALLGGILWAFTLALATSGMATNTTAAATDPTADRYYSGNALYNKKLFVLAIPEYEGFLKQHPAHPKADSARLGLALSYYASGCYADADPLLADLIRSGKAGDPHYLSLLRGQCLLRVGKAAAAQTVFEDAATGDAKNRPAAYAALAEIAFQQTNWVQTIEWVGKLAGIDPKGPWIRRAAYQAAFSRQQLGQTDAAIAALEALLPQLTPEDAPLPAQTSFLLGECFRAVKRHADAATAYGEAIKAADPSLAVEIQFRIGVVNLELNRPADAVVAFRAALAMKPSAALSDRIRLNLGRALVARAARKDLEEAATLLQPLAQASGNNPVSAEAALWLARIWVRNNRPSEAISVLTEAIRRNAGNPILGDLYFECGNLQMDGHAYSEAARSFSNLLDTSPSWPQRNDALRLLTVCLHHLKQYDESLLRCDAFLARYPSDPFRAEVLFLKAENLLLLNRAEPAAAAYAAVLSSGVTNANTDASAFRLAMFHYRARDWARTLETAAPLERRSPAGELFAPLPFIIGDACFRLDRWAAAVSNLDVYVRHAKPQDDNIDTAIVEIGIAHVNLCQTNAALAQFSLLAKKFPKSRHTPMALSEMGRLYFERGDAALSREALTRLLAEFPDAPQCAMAAYQLGWVARGAKNEEDAARQFDAVARKYPKDPHAPDAALQKGLSLLAMEKYGEANAAFDELLKRFPAHPRMDLVLFSNGIALARMQQWQRAETALQRFLEQNPTSEKADRALYEIAWCEKGLRRPTEAARNYTLLLDKHPGSPLASKARTELAELSFEASRFDQTIAELQKSLATLRDPKLREESLYRLGTAQFNNGALADCAATFQSFSKEFPNSTLLSSAQFQAGESHMKLGNLQKALGLFADAVATSGQRKDATMHEAALLRLAETQGLAEEWSASSKSCAEFLKRHPKSQYLPLVRFNQGWALENLKQYEPAIDAFRAVVQRNERDSLSARCQFHIGECLYGLRRYDEALTELVRVESVFRNEEWIPKALLEMGRVLEAKGDVTKAQTQFKELIRRYPKQEAAKLAKERLDAVRMSQ